MTDISSEVPVNRTFLTRLTVAAAVLAASVALAQPANDTCAGAEVINGAGPFPALSTAVNLTGATSDSAAPISCQSSNNSSVWYSFTPATSGLYTIQNCTPAGNTLSDTALAVYTGPCTAPVAVVGGCNDDGCSLRSTVTLTLTAGTTYLVQVAKYGTTLPAATDTMQIQIEQVLRPANDTCSGTIPQLQLNTPVVFATNVATTNDSIVGGNIDGGAGTCYVGVGNGTTASSNSGVGRDLTFGFTPTAAGTYSLRLNAPSTGVNSLLYLTDSCVDAMTPPQSYAPPQCLAAANRQTTFVTGGEELVCLSLAAGVPVFAHVDDGANSTTTPTFELEVTACTPEQAGNDTTAAAGPLSCPVTGSTSPAADVDFFALGSGGGRVYAMVDATTSNNNGYDLRVTTDTATLEYDNSDVDTAFGSSSATVSGTQLTAGTAAFLRVNQNSATTVSEPYRLYSVIQSGTPTPEVEPNDTLAQAWAGTTNYFSGDVSTTTDTDLFAFEGKAGDVVFISLDSEPTRASATATGNHSLALLNAAGTVLVSVADSNSTVNNAPAATPSLTATQPVVPAEGLVYRIRTNGVYFARVTRVSSTGTGAYHLSIATNCGTGGGISAPTATDVSPATGTVLGNTSVTITGTGFNAATTVRFGSNAATITARTATTLTVTTPAGNVGPVDVVVTNPGNQSATLTGGFTYFEPILPPTIASVTPNTGPTAGGTSVTLDGTLFKAGAEVTFTVGTTAVAATNVVVVSAVRLTCTTPPHAAGVASVTVRNPADALEGTLASAFTYLAPPTITQVSPASGLTTGGLTVTITGTAFRAGATVRFGTTAGTNVVVDPSGTSLTVTTPAVSTNGVVDVTVTNTDTQTTTATGAFTYLYPAPVLASVTPSSGFETGGTAVTLRGTNFVTGATVTVGGVAATGVSFVSSTEVRATTPAGTGLVDVVLTNVDTQATTLAQSFRYVPAPTVTAIAPNHGPVQGGTRVTLTGTNFVPGAAVFIGGVPAFAVDVTSATTATAITNAGAPGPADVRLVNPDTQAATLAGAYTYDPGPTLVSLSPISGTTAGGTTVTLEGTGFLTGATVLFGTDAATSVTVVSPTQLTAVTPARAVGVVSVTVRNTDNQSAELPRAFRFVAPPTLTAIAPTTGDVAGGTVVRLTGTGFNAGSTVSFGGGAATQVTLVSGTELDAVTPAHMPGAVDVVVTTDGASATLAGAFTYTRSAPTVTAVAPVSGPTTGGTLLTLTGTGFAPGATITVGGVAATGVVIVAPELARAILPAHAAGVVDVVVTNDDMQAGTLTGGFTYVTPPSGNTGLVDAGTGAVGADPDPVNNVPGGVSCGCTSFDGSMFSLGGMGLLLLLSRRRRR